MDTFRLGDVLPCIPAVSPEPPQLLQRMKEDERLDIDIEPHWIAAHASLIGNFLSFDNLCKQFGPRSGLTKNV